MEGITPRGEGGRFVFLLERAKRGKGERVCRGGVGGFFRVTGGPASGAWAFAMRGVRGGTEGERPCGDQMWTETSVGKGLRNENVYDGKLERGEGEEVVD